MEQVIQLLALKPILYGLIGTLISGLCFPLAGVIIVRNSLIPMRYMLMHGVILGGIFSIALKLPLLPVVIFINIILVLLMVFLNKEKSTNLSTVSTMMMVCTMGIASLLSHIFDVPAKDTLELLWGSPFTLTKIDLCTLIILALIIIVYISCFFKQISMIFFDSDIAMSMKINVKFHNTIMLFVTALIISVAMKMIGALLIDTLVILPVVCANKSAKGLKDLFIKSSLTGFIISFAGYFFALIFNLPLSGILATLAVLWLIFSNIIYKIKVGKK